MITAGAARLFCESSHIRRSHFVYCKNENQPDDQSLGFALGNPSLSWTVEEASGKKQQWARVEVAADPMFSKILWDSGEADLSSIDCPLPLTLSPRTRYWWRVTVCADNGETAVSEAAWFETGKMDEPFAGEWITPSLEKDVHPLDAPEFFPAGKAGFRPGLRCGTGTV